MGNSKPKLSVEEENVRKEVIEHYIGMTYEIFYNKQLYFDFNEIIKNMKIKSMSIGYCPLKFTEASLAIPNAVHAYAFFELIFRKDIWELLLNMALIPKQKLERIIFIVLIILLEMG